MKKIGFVCLILSLAACNVSHQPKSNQSPPPKSKQSHQSIEQSQDHFSLINQAMMQSQGRVKAVLAETRKMTLMQEIIKGGCWDFLDTAWTRAGVPRQARQIIYANKIGGTYANPNQLQIGDWIYYVNHSYHDIEPSGMFIGWTDKPRHIGLILSYAGEHRAEPARYREYDLSHVYHITRAE